MNRKELLLTQLNEELAEVQQEVSKCIRFGPEEIYPEVGISNAQRVINELHDVEAMLRLLVDEGVLPPIVFSIRQVDEKMEKVEKHLDYSRKCGTLQ